MSSMAIVRSLCLSVLVVWVGFAPQVRAAEPRRIWLWFADGGPVPMTSPAICAYGMSPPAYACTFASSPAACRLAIQAWLDKWYADFNVVFTYQRPTSGPHDTIIVAAEGAWCLADDRTTSQSPLPTCEVADSGALVVFQCRDDARKCASIIAQEQAHIVGLEHTPSPTDVMNPAFPPDHDGFEDRDNPVTNVKCRRPQNSYRLMLERLGAWPGGPKPSPEAPPASPADAASGDGEAPADADEPTDAATDEAHDPVDQVGDRPQATDVTPAAPRDGGGCSCNLGARSSLAPGAWLSTLAVAVVACRRRRRRR